MSATNFLNALRQSLRVARALDWTLPAPPPEPPDAAQFRLMPLPASQFAPLPEPQELDAVREELARVAVEYTDGPGGGVLLCAVPAGVGKTHALLSVAQRHAREGGRVLWAAQDHAAWDDMQQFAEFDPELWLHWRGILYPAADGVPQCRHARHMDDWIRRGFPAFEYCKQMCSSDGYMADGCPYHAQSRSAAPCVFGQHAHLNYGLPGKKFTLAIVDELPIKAFVSERGIPWLTGVLPESEQMREHGGPLGQLGAALQRAQLETGTDGSLSGMELLEILGPALDDVYAAVETGFFTPPEIPLLSDPADAGQCGYFFVGQLLHALTIEHAAWRAGWPEWATRVWTTPTALHILGRNSLWDKLPKKLIALDATARPELYAMLFRQRVLAADGESAWVQREIAQVYAPRVKRVGELHQITGRLYSKKQLYRFSQVQLTDSEGRVTRTRKITPLAAFEQLVQTIVAICAQRDAHNVGVITYLDIEELLVEALRAQGLDATSRHFYKVRGTNSMRAVDAVFVVGTPTPDTRSLVKIATALDATRQKAFYTYTPDGHRMPVYSSEVTEFRLTPAALEKIRQWPGFAEAQAVGRLVGVYADPDLRAIHEQLSRAETLQAAHRGRINIQDVAVFVLTATPLLDEPLDSIADAPEIGPRAIAWRTWLKLAEWLDAQALGTVVFAEQLAEVTGCSLAYIKRHAWIAEIIKFYAERDGQWHAPDAMQKGRGRPRAAMHKQTE